MTTVSKWLPLYRALKLNVPLDYIITKSLYFRIMAKKCDRM